MDKKQIHTLSSIAFGVTLFVVLMNMEGVLSFLGHISNVILPIVCGLLLAFMLSIPAGGIEKGLLRFFENKKHSPSKTAIRAISVFLTYTALICIITLLCTMVIPALTETVRGIIYKVELSWPTWLALVESWNIDISWLSEWLRSFNLQMIIEQLVSNAESVIDSVTSAATSTISVVVNLMTGIIISIYALFSRDTLSRQAKMLLYASLKETAAKKICRIAGMIRSSYARFLSWQVLESLLLGVLMLVSFLIFDLPYAGLVAAVTAVCALVPYIGAFISCAVAVLLSLLVGPQKAIVCFIVYQVVQFIESQFIYPHVVGKSVGLSPFWTLAAVLIGGKLFGLLGMIFFLPLAAVIYELLREYTYNKLKTKNLVIE